MTTDRVDWLTVDDVMDTTGLSRHQVYRRIQSGRLPATWDREGKLRYRVSREALNRYIADRDTSTAADQGAEMLRVPDVATILGFTAETVRRMCMAGEIGHVRGRGERGHYRIPRSAVQEYMERNRNTPAA